MTLVIVDVSNTRKEGWRLDEAHSFRHRIFVEEMGWEALRRPDELEVDSFDDIHAVHMLLYDSAKLVGYQRLLPTLRPYLLTEIYPHLCDRPPPRSPSCYEWTRFAVAPGYRGDGRGLGRAGARLVLGYVEWGLDRGVDAVVAELYPAHLAKFHQCRFRVTELGPPHRIDGREVVAVVARFDLATRDTLRRLL